MTPERAKELLSAAVLCELKRLGWSQNELARRSDITRQTMSNICKGRHEPKASLLKSIAETLGVSMDYLLREPHSKRRVSIKET